LLCKTQEGKNRGRYKETKETFEGNLSIVTANLACLRDEFYPTGDASQNAANPSKKGRKARP